MATLTEFLGNLSEVITTGTAWFTSIMSVFMEPPLVVFLGLGIFGSVVYLVKSLLHK